MTVKGPPTPAPPLPSPASTTSSGAPPSLAPAVAGVLHAPRLTRACACARTAFQEEVRVRWDLDAVKRAVLASQRRRLIVQQALQQGRGAAWEFQPSSETRYPGWVGSQEMTERFARFPLKPTPFLPAAEG